MQILGLQRKLKNAVLNPYPIALQGFTQVITPPVVSHIIGVGAREHQASYLRTVPIAAHAWCE
jgi:hypothetical protein